VAVAVSGGGRSLRNFLERQRPGQGYEIAAVIASRPDCKGVEIARAAGLPVFIETFTAARLAEIGTRLYAWLDELQISWIALAGFLKMFPLDPRWDGKIVNIHPALLPRFGGHGMYGDRVHAAVVASGAATSGATIHYVNDKYDEGRIIAQIEVPVRPGDDAHALADRVFAAECELYPAVLDALIAGTLPHRDGRIERRVHDS
jgi:folate-dependent phosphoribosylglycinamide formyltransferase PurN